jgi:hypothetical protein
VVGRRDEATISKCRVGPYDRNCLWTPRGNAVYLIFDPHAGRVSVAGIRCVHGCSPSLTPNNLTLASGTYPAQYTNPHGHTRLAVGLLPIVFQSEMTVTGS